MKNHWLWMVIGCGLPLLLIFFAPAFGITGNNGLFGFIILMFVFHLFMPHGGHGHGGHGRSGKTSDHEQSKGEATVESHNDPKGHSNHY